MHRKYIAMGKNYLKWAFGFFIPGCKGLVAENRVSAKLPGTYINQSAFSDGRAFDMLSVQMGGENANIYAVDRSVFFNSIREGKLRTKQYHLNHWIAVYDESTNALTDVNSGRAIAYMPGKKKLYLGNKAYLKLKK